MKKSILTLALIFFVTVANAQIFVGGGVGFNTQSGKVTISDGSNSKEVSSGTSTRFSIAPLIGYNLNEKLAVGFQAGFGMSDINSTPNVNPTNSFIYWYANPFARYSFLKFNKFSVYGQGNLNISVNNSKVKVNSSISSGPSSLNFGFSVFPGMLYDLNKRISLFTELNFFSLSFNHGIYTTKSELEGNVTTTKSSGNTFNFGVSSDNLINTSSIQIGFHVNL